MDNNSPVANNTIPTAPMAPMSPVSPVKPFASGHVRALLSIAALAVGIVLDLIAIVSDFMEIGLLSGIQAGGVITNAEAAANDTRQLIIGVLQIVVYLVTVVLFLMWIHRAHRNLPALGAQGLKYSPGWAVGGFFVPFLNLVRPFQVMKEIWKASSPGHGVSDFAGTSGTLGVSGTSWQTAPVSPLLGLWWGVWLLSGVLGQVAVRLSSADTVEGLLTSSWMTLLSDAMGIVAAVLIILIIRQIDSRQEEKALGIVPPATLYAQPTF